MLAATVTIRHIDYENTLRNIFPVIQPKLQTVKSQKMLIRLFQQLGDAALPVLLGVMSRLPEGTKNALLLAVLNAYAPEGQALLNRELHKDTWGQCFTVGSLSMTQGEAIHLVIGQIQVDYKALLRNDKISDALDSRLGRLSALFKGAVGVATAVAGNAVERRGLELLWKEDNQQRLLQLVRRILHQNGILMEVETIALAQEERSEAETPAAQPLTLTESMEADILAALAGYLKEVAK